MRSIGRVDNDTDRVKTNQRMSLTQVRQGEVTAQPSGITFASATKHTTNSTPRLSVMNGANSVPTPNLPRNRPG